MTASINEFDTYYWPAVCLDCHTVSSVIKTGFSFDTVMSMQIPENCGLKPCSNCGSNNRRTYGASVTISNEGLKVENSVVDSKFMSAMSNIFSGYEKATGQTIIHLRYLQELRKAKACTCGQIKSFELKEFGRIDHEALKADFGC